MHFRLSSSFHTLILNNMARVICSMVVRKTIMILAVMRVEETGGADAPQALADDKRIG